MALILLSVFLSLILGCLVWVILGERFPFNDDIKLPPLNNVVIYTLLAIGPVYLTIFFLYHSGS
ncbi:MAG: hypothetical protein WD356_05425 [Pseudomonadales bacterium]